MGQVLNPSNCRLQFFYERGKGIAGLNDVCGIGSHFHTRLVWPIQSVEAISYTAFVYIVNVTGAYVPRKWAMRGASNFQRRVPSNCDRASTLSFALLACSWWSGIVGA